MNLRSHIVYKYKCANCNIDYVGQTFLQLKMRAFNSMGISFRTNLPNSQPENLAVRDHYDLNRHRISLQKFSILQNASKGEELKNLESFYIKSLKPTLNIHKTSLALLIACTNCLNFVQKRTQLLARFTFVLQTIEISCCDGARRFRINRNKTNNK